MLLILNNIECLFYEGNIYNTMLSIILDTY